ncbi:MAG TPA: nucleotidyltransferase family protein [Candidatus Saccharimonadales bacterium]|nr:nucleotidyltransferase family protein [Candidatus Saccharimonadales bacterium]
MRVRTPDIGRTRSPDTHRAMHSSITVPAWAGMPSVSARRATGSSSRPPGRQAHEEPMSPVRTPLPGEPDAARDADEARGAPGPRDASPRPEVALPALVLAGGLGLRLRSVTGDLPKILATVGGEPFLHYVLARLRRDGIRDVTLCTGYGADAVRRFAGTGEAWDLRIDYSEETTPLGTAGALRLATAESAHERFLVLNGDSYFDIDLRDLVEAHARLGGLVTIAARRAESAGRFGAVRIGADGAVEDFEEKREAGPATINGGIYVIERSVLTDLPADVPVSLERDVFPAMVGAVSGDAPASGGLMAALFDGFFVDIGIPDDHARIDREPGPLLGRAVRC